MVLSKWLPERGISHNILDQNMMTAFTDTQITKQQLRPWNHRTDRRIQCKLHHRQHLTPCNRHGARVHVQNIGCGRTRNITVAIDVCRGCACFWNARHLAHIIRGVGAILTATVNDIAGLLATRRVRNRQGYFIARCNSNPVDQTEGSFRCVIFGNFSPFGYCF